MKKVLLGETKHTSEGISMWLSARGTFTCAHTKKKYHSRLMSYVLNFPCCIVSVSHVSMFLRLPLPYSKILNLFKTIFSLLLTCCMKLELFWILHVIVLYDGLGCVRYMELMHLLELLLWLYIYHQGITFSTYVLLLVDFFIFLWSIMLIFFW